MRSAHLREDRSEFLIPNQPGIFVPLEPESDLEFLLTGRLPEDRVETEGVELDPDDPFSPPEDPQLNSRDTSLQLDPHFQIVTVQTGDRRDRFAFFPDDDFLPDERRAFLGVLFRTPLRAFRLSSPFGARIHPFTARPSYHTGIDMVASEGTPVRAAREGKVVATGSDPVYGLYVILRHDTVFSSFYGHMSSVSVELNDVVSSGMILGEVGNTGLSTGPHLHFEIRVRGAARDPLQFLPSIRQPG